MTNDIPAFPSTFPIMQPSQDVPGALEKVGTQYFQGMTIIDYMAGQALAGALSNDSFLRTIFEGSEEWKIRKQEGLARYCYDIAQAMLAERSKEVK